MSWSFSVRVDLTFRPLTDAVKPQSDAVGVPDTHSTSTRSQWLYVSDALPLAWQDVVEVTALTPLNSQHPIQAVLFEKASKTHTTLPAGPLPLVAAPYSLVVLMIMANTGEPMTVDVHFTWRLLGCRMRHFLMDGAHNFGHCACAYGALKFTGQTLGVTDIEPCNSSTKIFGQAHRDVHIAWVQAQRARMIDRPTFCPSCRRVHA